VLNGGFLDSEVIRARSAAFLLRHNKPDPEFWINFTGTAILKLADYGVHLRDSRDGLVNYILGYYNQQKSFKSIGDPDFKGKNSFSIGLGKESHRRIAFGSKCHVFLKRAFLPSNTVKENLIIPEDLSPKISIGKLKQLTKEFKKKHFEETANIHNFWEWVNDFDNLQDDLPTNISAWSYVNIAEKLRTKFPNSYWLLSDHRIRQEAHYFSVIHESQSKLFNLLSKHEAPAFIATDGAHSCHQRNSNAIPHSTTSAAVICIPRIELEETLESGEWKHRTAIPMLARMARLPHSFGCHQSDIAHGEGMGVCLGLEMLHNNYPKVIITDSTSTRDIFRKIRDRKNTDTQDRYYIRKVASGISKYICDRLESKVIDYTLPGHEQEFKKARENLHSWLQDCETWTCQPSSTEDPDTASLRLWKHSYFDKHEHTSILKVDSHQLSDDGRKLKTNPRYGRLVPNLFLLSCNHHADVSASLVGTTKFFQSSDMHQFHLPPSKLRFFFTWGGKSIDRHISDFLYLQFQREKVKHLRTKSTQGLPWRVLSDSTCSWEELKNEKGLFRLLRGLTRCHTRSLYKSIRYRKGWMAKDMEGSNQQTNTLTKTSISQQTWILNLTPCRWCASKTSPKGNRTHATLFCSHPLLESYRNNMTSLIESKLYHFIRQISSTYSEDAAEIFLQHIEETMLDLHGMNKETEYDHTKYRTRNNWRMEEGVDSWKDLLDSKIPIYSMIFGMVPIMESSMPSDSDIKIVHCIPFGLIPIALENQVQHMIQSIHKYNPCQLSCNSISASFRCFWNEIKDLNIKRIIGLHRIIGLVSKEYEKSHGLQYKIDDNLMKKIKRPLQNRKTGHAKVSSILKRKNPSCMQKQSNKKRKKVKFEQSETPKKSCSGITCNRELSSWNENTIIPHRINHLQKHCGRCSRQSTAVKKCITILDICRNSEKSREKRELLSFMDDSNRKIDFKKAKTLLNKITVEPCIGATSKINDSKNAQKGKDKCTDAEKLLINVLSKSIGEQTNRQDDPNTRLKSASSTLHHTSQHMNNFLKDDLKRNSSLTQELEKRKSYIQKDISKQINKGGISTVIREKVWCSNSFQRQQSTSITQVANYNQLVGGDAINLAIMNLRFLKLNKIFIGNAATSTVISTCTSNKDWLDFSPCFGNKEALEKPHGTYIFPIFESGHWYFILIDKRKSLCRGWVIDSLGTGATTSNIANRVKKLFTMARRKCSWIPTKATRQTEMECGPRTVCGMVSICRSLRDGLDIQEAIKVATSLSTTEKSYNSMHYRTEAKKYMEVNTEVKNAYEKGIAEMRREKRKLTNNVRKSGAKEHRKGEIVELC